MELIVVMGVFSISSMIIVEIFMFTNKSQKKVIQAQRLQSDLSYTLETMARAVRLGKIDYDAYYVIYGNGAIPSPVNELFLKDADGRQVVFKKGMNAADGCPNDESSPCIIQGIDTDANGTADQFASLTPRGLKIVDTETRFYVWPTIDPFLRQACAGDMDCDYSVSCLVTKLCAVPNQQPVVTMTLSTIQTDKAETDPMKMNVQTSVSSRQYYR